MAAKYQLKEGRTGKWRWNLLARNGKVIATSEPYETRRSALAGIESVRRNADAPLEDLSTPAPATRTAAGSGRARKAAPAAKSTASAAKTAAPKTKTASAAKTAAPKKKTAPAAKTATPKKKTAPAARATSRAGRAATADGSAPAMKSVTTSGANRRRSAPDTTTAEKGTRRTSGAAARDLEAAAVARADVAAAAYSPEVQDVLEQALPGGTAPPSPASADAALGLDPVDPAGR